MPEQKSAAPSVPAPHEHDIHRFEGDGGTNHATEPDSSTRVTDHESRTTDHGDAAGMFFPNRPQQFTGLDWQEVDLQDFAMIAGCLVMPFGVLQHGDSVAQKLHEQCVLLTRPNAEGDHERFLMRFPATVKILLEPYAEEKG